jgi:hypothetical protein
MTTQNQGEDIIISLKPWKGGTKPEIEGKIVIVRLQGLTLEYQVVGYTVNKLTDITTKHDEFILQKIKQYHVPQITRRSLQK